MKLGGPRMALQTPHFRGAIERSSIVPTDDREETACTHED